VDRVHGLIDHNNGDNVWAHHGPMASGGYRLVGAEASQHCGARGLAAIGGKDRGDTGEPYHGLQRQPQRWRWASGRKGQRQRAKLVIAVFRPWRKGLLSLNGRRGGRGCSRHPFYRPGW
jgi:hypothetical protein